MKTFVIVSMFASTLLAAAVTASYAQNAGDQEKGSTGWSGGSKDQPTQARSQSDPANATAGQKVQVHDESLAKDQAPIATGEDLKGPPAQLAPSKTPE